MAIFNSYVSHYQRVTIVISCYIYHKPSIWTRPGLQSSAPSCVGIEYSRGRCEVWTRPAGIGASIPLTGPLDGFRGVPLVMTVCDIEAMAIEIYIYYIYIVSFPMI